MDILYFWEVIWRRKWLLIGAAGIAVVLTFFLSGLRPLVYKSNAVLSTGITLEKRIDLSKQDVFVQKYEIESAFSNLIANMKSRTSLRLLTYRLLLHDLYAERTSGKSFRSLQPDTDLSIDESDIRSLIRALQLRTDTLLVDLPLEAPQEAHFKELAKAYAYDFESLDENLHIDRLGETDYVRIEFESENPELCKYAVNVFTDEFMDYHMQTVSRDEYEAVRFYENLAREKESRVNLVSNELSGYRRSNNIVNMDEQSRSVVALLKDLEYQRELAKQAIPAHRRNIDRLNTDLDEMVAMHNEQVNASTVVKDHFSQIQKEIKDIRGEHPWAGSIAGPMYVNQLAFKRSYRDSVIEKMADLLISTPDDEDAATMQNLLEKRVDEEILLTLNEETVNSIDNKINELREESESLVSAEERIGLLESQKEIAIEEYLYALGKLNEAKVVAQSALNPLSIFEHAQLPEEPEPSKRLIYSAFSGAATAGFGIFLLFFLTLFDSSLSQPAQFEKITGVSLLGPLNQLPARQRSLQDIFSHSGQSELLTFRESLRNIRHEIEISGARRFLFTSTQQAVGKTSVLLSLAYTMAKKDQRVLILDTNFKHNSLSEYANMEPDFNPLQDDPGTANLGAGDSIAEANLPQTIGEVVIIGNNPSMDSPSEILAGKDFEGWLRQLETSYDFVFLEGPALNQFSDTRELVNYVDKVIVLFDAAGKMKRPDQESLRYLDSLKDKFMGAILNRVNPKHLDQ